MTPLLPPRLPAWLLERVLPAPGLAFALGDLAEEYVLRARATSSSAADLWYWRQICRSVPALLGDAVRHAGYLQTIGVAVAVYVVANAAESVAHGGLGLLALTGSGYYLASLAVGLAAIACGGYVAARIRQPAALLMPPIVFVVVVALMARGGHEAPLWYQLTFLVAGPLAPIAGAIIAALSKVPRSYATESDHDADD